ncbi:MAG: hypothetical protein ACOYD0_13115 [Candidatus Nanopelagicales bacterium]
MVAVITAAVEDLGPDLLIVAGLGLAVGVSIFGLKKGWGIFRKFTS